MQKPELLAPAGNLEKLKAAVVYGADAVYLGGKEFSLRAGAANFDRDSLAKGVEFAHRQGAKVYAAVNIFAHNEDLVALPQYIAFLQAVDIDAVIASDPGIIAIIKSTAPNLPIHLSTQANSTNWAGVQFWQEQGVSRVVLARELSLTEIAAIAQKVKIELEVFVHGAMCMAYSGRCLLSNYFTDRDANRGDCAQACRWQYHLVEQKRPNQYFPVVEDERGTYFMSSRDLSLIAHIPSLVQAGVTSFKIEGRMKSVHYVATVVKYYRQAIDRYFADQANYQLNPLWLGEIAKVSHRDYTTGFLLGSPGTEVQSSNATHHSRKHLFVGIVRAYQAGVATIEQRNRFAVGDQIEIMQPQGDNFTMTVPELVNVQGEKVAHAPHPQEIIQIPLPQPVEPWSIVRKIKTPH